MKVSVNSQILYLVSERMKKKKKKKEREKEKKKRKGVHRKSLQAA